MVEPMWTLQSQTTDDDRLGTMYYALWGLERFRIRFFPHRNHLNMS